MTPASISAETAPAAWRADLRLCLVVLLALAAWDLSGADLVAVRGVGDAAGFPLRDHWFVSGWLHSGGRALGWLVFGVLTLGLWVRLPVIHVLDRRELLTVLATCLLGVLAVNALKYVSLTSCPWSLAEFGGTAQHVSHWALGVRDGAGGGCFPSGHATTAFSFLPLAFALRRRRPTAARAVTAVIVLAGVVFGAAQMLRGAHYPSHTMWTGFVCLMIASVADAWSARRR